MATSQLAPMQGFAERVAESDKAYWLWRRRSVRLRLVASGAVSWLLHAGIAVLVLWGGESLVTRRSEPPRVDVVAAVGETMGAPGVGDDGLPPSPRQGFLTQPADNQPTAAGAKFIPDSLPSAVTDSLPKVGDLKLPGAEIVGPIIGANGDLIGGIDSGADSGGAGRGGGGGTGTSGLGPGWTNTEFIGITGVGSRFVYVIDHSGSMGEHDRLGAVKRELLASLSKLPPETQFQVVFYNLRVDVMGAGAGRTPRLIFATDANKNMARRYLEGVFANGGTEHAPALRAALSLNPDVIFFLTDAADLKMHDVQEATGLNRGRASIHAIEFAVGPAQDQENMLRILAQSNHGTYKYVDVGKLDRGDPQKR